MGDGTAVARTNATGEFSFGYRPTTEPLGKQNLTVTFVPRNDSLYSRSSDGVLVRIEATGSSITATRDPGVVAFGDALSVSGRIEAAGRGVGGLPVTVALDGRSLGRTRTGGDGAYALSGTVPATVDAGSANVTARMPLRGRAIAPANATTAVRVASTPSSLSASGTRTGPRTARVAGDLSAGGAAVPGAVVTLSADGTTLAEVRTGGDGRFASTVDLPGSVDAADNLTVEAAYRPTGGNVGPSRGRVELEPYAPAASTDTPESGGVLAPVRNALTELLNPLSPLAWVVFAVVLLAAGAAVYAWRREGVDTGGRSWTEGAEPPDPESEPTSEREPIPEPASEEVDADVGPLDTARERLDGGDPDSSVVVAYDAVRRELAERLPVEGSAAMTHWEAFTAYRDALSDEQAAALRRLTEAYETAAYTPRTNPREAATRSIADAAQVLDGATGGADA
ncbi:MAG: hypothetical protein ABEJ28_06245 [Salinigranum sp.]